jgi:spermidine synthase
MKERLLLQGAMVLAGFTSLVAQILMTRELLIAYSDYELFLGIILGWWLALVGLSGILSGRLADRLDIGRRGLAVSFLIFPWVLVLEMSLVRYLQFLKVGSDTFIGFWGVVFYSMGILIPSSAVIGFQFPVAARCYGRAAPAGSGERSALTPGASRIYAVESFGSILGGVLYGFVFLPHSHPFHTAFILGIGSCLAAMLVLPESKRSLRSPLPLATVLMPAAFLLALASGAVSFYERETEALRWSRSDYLVYSRDSRYGEIEVLEDKKTGNRTFRVNNTGMFALYGDQLHNEEAAHLPLLRHPTPRVVALIGGGIGGAVKEILKHPVERLYYVEINPSVIEAGRIFFGDQLAEPLQDPRVRIVNLDGRYFLKNPPEPLDVIIIDFQDPYALQRVRFYSVNFFREARRALAPGGILLTQGYNSSHRRYLDGQVECTAYETADRLNACIYRGLQQVFRRVEMIPGSWDYFLALAEEDRAGDDPSVLGARLEERKILTRYMGERYFRELFRDANLSRQRAYLATTPVRPSTDGWPVIFLYDLHLWSGTGYPELGYVLEKLRALPRKSSPVLLSILFIPLLLTHRRQRINPFFLMLLIASTGFSAMAVEMLAIYELSTVFGYFYEIIGVVFALFLGGIVLGNRLAERRPPGEAASPVPALLAADLLLLAVVLATGSFSSIPNPSAPLVFAFVFAIVSAAGGCLGFEFCIASRMAAGFGSKSGTAAGRLYGADILGGALGAFLAAPILLPALGIPSLSLRLWWLKFSVLSLCLVGFKRSLPRPGRAPSPFGEQLRDPD